MSASIHQLAPQRLPPIAEREARVLGAALHLRLNIGDFESLSIGAECFSIGTFRKAWQIARTKASRNLVVTAATVTEAGLAAKWFTPDEARQLVALEDSNTLTRPEFLQVAGDFWLSVLQERTAIALETEARNLRGGGVFNPGHVATVLETIAHQLQRDTAPDEDASGDVIRVSDTWDTNEKTKKSRLLPTRIASLDAEIGGFPPGLTVITGRPGTMKTGVLDSIIYAQLNTDKDLELMLIGLEDGTDHVFRRWVAWKTGMLLRDVGWRQRTPEERIAYDECRDLFTPLLRRLHVYRHDSIRPAELRSRTMAARKKFGIRGAYLDNLTEVDFSQRRHGSSEFEAIAETGRVMRNLGLREEFAIVFVSHTTGDVKDGDIPDLSDLAGGQALGRRIRLLISCWMKGQALRLTIGKANELGAGGTTIEAERLKSSGLIRADADPVKINLHAERAVEKAQKARERAVEQDALAEEKKKIRLARAAAVAKAAEPPAQARLLDVPSTEKP